MCNPIWCKWVRVGSRLWEHCHKKYFILWNVLSFQIHWNLKVLGRGVEISLYTELEEKIPLEVCAQVGMSLVLVRESSLMDFILFCISMGRVWDSFVRFQELES